jgi:hypothetical protein
VADLTLVAAVGVSGVEDSRPRGDRCANDGDRALLVTVGRRGQPHAAKPDRSTGRRSAGVCRARHPIRRLQGTVRTGLFCDVSTHPNEIPAWCTRLLAELVAADVRASLIATPLTPDQLNWKPHAGEWSVGQCLDHLCVSNAVYCQAMSRSLVDRPVAIVQEITPGWFGRWFIRNYIEPSSTTRRRRAPKKIAPGTHVEPSILGRFLDSNHAARELVRRAGSHDVNRIRFQNPFVPVIWFTVGTGLEILSKHQRRHLLQAERIRDALEVSERQRAS